MYWIDILILIIILATMLIGVWRGFVQEVLSLLSWVAAFVIARLFAPDVANWLEGSIESDAVILLLSWVIPFLTTLIVFHFLKLLLISLITIVGLRPVDRILGAAFGAMKGTLLITAIVLIVQLILAGSGDAFKTQSRLIPHFQVVALWMLKTLDDETELSLDNAVSRFGKLIDSGRENIDLQSWKDKLGMSTDDLKKIFEDEKKLSELKAMINDPEIIEKLKTMVKSEECNKDNC